jgi:hypothetical protein
LMRAKISRISSSPRSDSYSPAKLKLSVFESVRREWRTLQIQFS